MYITTWSPRSLDGTAMKKKLDMHLPCETLISKLSAKMRVKTKEPPPSNYILPHFFNPHQISDFPSMYVFC